MQSAATKIVAGEVVVGGGVGVYATAGGFTPVDCGPTNWADLVLYPGADFVFTISNLIQVLGIISTSLAAIYFAYQIYTKIFRN